MLLKLNYFCEISFWWSHFKRERDDKNTSWTNQHKQIYISFHLD